MPSTPATAATTSGLVAKYQISTAKKALQGRRKLGFWPKSTKLTPPAGRWPVCRLRSTGLQLPTSLDAGDVYHRPEHNNPGLFQRFGTPEGRLGTLGNVQFTRKDKLGDTDWIGYGNLFTYLLYKYHRFRTYRTEEYYTSIEEDKPPSDVIYACKCIHLFLNPDIAGAQGAIRAANSGCCESEACSAKLLMGCPVRTLPFLPYLSQQL